MPATMQTEAYKKLVMLVRRFGGRVVVSRDRWKADFHHSRHDDFPTSTGPQGWSGAPFCSNIGVYWKEKVIVHKRTGFTNAGLIHEMAHVFASKHSPNSSKCEETDFLGWELELAKKTGVLSLWLREMASYGLQGEDNNFTEIGMLGRAERKRIFARYRLEAQERGSLGPRGEIRSVRN